MPFLVLLRKINYYQIKWTKHSTKHNVRYKSKKKAGKKGILKVSLTSAVIINHSYCLPLEEVDQVQDGPAER